MLPARYFDGRSARAHDVVLGCENGRLSVAGDGGLRRDEPLTAVSLSPRLGGTRRRIEFADGAVCELDDSPLLDVWFAESHHRRWNLLARLETHWGMIAAALVLVVALTAALAVWGLPWAAAKVAPRLPQEWVVQLGKGTLSVLDNSFGESTALPARRQQELQRGFAPLARDLDIRPTLVFRNWPRMGPNALALPDGTIVMTDQLVALASDDRELLAVLAHELGHVHERHALQRVMASSGVAALLFVLTGDVSGLSSVALAAPTILTHLHHSRALESAADRYAFALMSRNGLDPVWFARIIRKLESAHAPSRDADDDAPTGWLQSHPASEERAKHAERFRAWH